MAQKKKKKKEKINNKKDEKIEFMDKKEQKNLEKTFLVLFASSIIVLVIYLAGLLKILLAF